MEYDFRVKFGVINEISTGNVNVTPDDALQALMETETIQPAIDTDGAMWTTTGGAIYVL